MTRSKTEQNYRDAGMKKPAHRDPVDEALTHVDPEYQPLDAVQAETPKRGPVRGSRTTPATPKES